MSDKKVILVVEDEVPLLVAIEAKLNAASFDTVTARSAEQGLNMLRDITHVDGIWLDHYLAGGKSGLDFLVEVKSNAEWKNLPVFVVTNTASSANKYSYLELGVTKYLVKADMRLGDIVASLADYFNHPSEK